MSKAPKKQLIFIMTDTQRADMLGCYGNTDMKTPHLDRMASDGTRFEKAYTCQPVCGPARSAIFTGTFPHSNGAWGNTMALGANVLTIGQRLSREGIPCGYIGKYHLDGGDYFGNGECPEGWEQKYWYDMRNYLEELSEEERRFSREVKSIEKGIDKTFTFGNRCSQRAMEFIEEYKDQDFFLVLSYDEPHHPFLCPQEYVEMYKSYSFPKSKNVWDTLENKPEHHKVWAGKQLHSDKNALKIQHDYFFACNSYVDAEIGAVYNKVKATVPEAMTIYTSDHGDHLQSHSLNNKGATMYEENIHIPLIIIDPMGEKDVVHPHPASHIDLTPTILEHFQIERSPNLEGKSLKPCLADNQVRVNPYIFSEFNRYEIDHDGFGGFQPIRCIMDGRYKLVINLLTSDELYDLSSDIEELNNLIESTALETQTIRNQLHDRLIQWMNETRDPFRGYYWENRPWRKDAPKPHWEHTAYTRQRHPERGEVLQLDYATGMPITEFSRPK